MSLKARIKRMQRRVGEKGDPRYCACPPPYLVRFARKGDELQRDEPCASCGRPREDYTVPLPGRG